MFISVAPSPKVVSERPAESTRKGNYLFLLSPSTNIRNGNCMPNYFAQTNLNIAGKDVIKVIRRAAKQRPNSRTSSSPDEGSESCSANSHTTL